MKKSFLSLALLIPALAAAQVRVEVAGTIKGINRNNDYTREVTTTLRFDEVGGNATINCGDVTLTYKLTATDEHVAVFAVDITHENDDQSTQLIASPTIAAEWGKEARIAIGDSAGESVELSFVAHQE